MNSLNKDRIYTAPQINERQCNHRITKNYNPNNRLITVASTFSGQLLAGVSSLDMLSHSVVGATHQVLSGFGLEISGFVQPFSKYINGFSQSVDRGLELCTANAALQLASHGSRINLTSHCAIVVAKQALEDFSHCLTNLLDNLLCSSPSLSHLSCKK